MKETKRTTKRVTMKALSNEQKLEAYVNGKRGNKDRS